MPFISETISEASKRIFIYSFLFFLPTNRWYLATTELTQCTRWHVFKTFLLQATAHSLIVESFQPFQPFSHSGKLQTRVGKYSATYKDAISINSTIPIHAAQYLKQLSEPFNVKLNMSAPMQALRTCSFIISHVAPSTLLKIINNLKIKNFLNSILFCETSKSFFVKKLMLNLLFLKHEIFKIIEL